MGDSTEHRTVNGVKSVRLLADVGIGLRELAEFEWSQKDASLYVTPAMPDGGVMYAGMFESIPPNARGDLNFGLQGVGHKGYVSFHASGQTHAKCRDGESRYRSEPIQGVPLFTGAGGHLATLDCFGVDGLPPVDVLRTGGRRDLILGIEQHPARRNVHVAVHTREEMPEAVGADKDFQLVVTMERPNMPRPLHLCFRIGSRENPGDDGGSAVMAFGGWGVDATDRDRVSMAYIVAQTRPTAARRRRAALT